MSYILYTGIYIYLLIGWNTKNKQIKHLSAIKRTNITFLFISKQQIAATAAQQVGLSPRVLFVSILGKVPAIQFHWQPPPFYMEHKADITNSRRIQGMGYY